MKKHFAAWAFSALIASGCASSDRMMRMSGGVFDEYSAPPSARIRSEKYQKVSRELSSETRSGRAEVAGMDDTLVNIWPFFFRSDAYWTILWPLVDKDPYGFAVRPIYNHEGDEYSILFPLSAWNPAAGDGWVTLFGWNETGFGFIPLTWQWREGLTGGAYYTPLFIYDYDENPLRYTAGVNGGAVSRWARTDHSLFCCFGLSRRRTEVVSGPWEWLYDQDYPQIENEWRYRFNGEKPFPESGEAFERFREEVFRTLPVRETRLRGFIPLWVNESSDNGDYENRFLLVAGNERRGKNFGWDIFGPLLAEYEDEYAPEDDRYRQGGRSFTSLALLSHFSAERVYRRTETWEKLDALRQLGWDYEPFSRRKPAMEAALEKLDPELELPPTVVDDRTYSLFVEDLRRRYSFPVRSEYTGTVLPLFYYNITQGADVWVIPPLLTGWKTGEDSFKFFSLPLMTAIRRSPRQDTSVILTPLVYCSKTLRRERRDYPVAARDRLSMSEWECAELYDRYAACGLFYRGRFGFNVAGEGIDAEAVEKLRRYLLTLPRERERLDLRLEDIDRQTEFNDRWQTSGEIERLKKLIRYEEIKQLRGELAADEADYQRKAADALAIAASLGIEMSAATLGDPEAARAAADDLIGRCTELRSYEDIGNGLFFRKEKFYNGDYNWHLLGILAGGEKSGDRESCHVLHLLYRHRREGDRSETVFFPFVSTVRDGGDSRFSFLWRVFSLSRRGGETGGYIFFIPFGNP